MDSASRTCGREINACVGQQPGGANPAPGGNAGGPEAEGVICCGTRALHATLILNTAAATGLGRSVSRNAIPTSTSPRHVMGQRTVLVVRFAVRCLRIVATSYAATCRRCEAANKSWLWAMHVALVAGRSACT